MLAAAGIFVFQNGGKISKTSKKPDGNGENSVTKSTSDEENRNTEENGADPDTIVKENVKVITRDTEAEKHCQNNDFQFFPHFHTLSPS